MKLNWHDAPTRTEWGHDMVVATVALGKDHSVDLYCERNKKAEAEALLKRPWVGLTDEDCDEVERWVEFKEEGSDRIQTSKLIRYIEAKIKEKNNAT
jgi:hypothetical protein